VPGSIPQSTGIARRLDTLPFTRLHLLLFTVLGLGLLFDQMEGSMTGVLAAVFTEPGSGVSRDALSSMMTLYYVVAAIGAPIMGFVADSFGRRMALAITLIGFGILTVASLAMPTFAGFAIFRIISSFAISAVPPLVFSYMADVFPPAARGVAMMLISVMAGIGGALAPMATHWGNQAKFGGLEGWQFAMLVAAVAGVVLGAVMLLLPESPRWLASKGRSGESERAAGRFEASRACAARSAVPLPDNSSLDQAVDHPETQWEAIHHYRARLMLVIAILFLQSSGLTGFALLLTKALLMKGMAMQSALAQSSLILMMMPVGVVVFAFVTDRVGRRTLFAGLGTALGISAILFGTAPIGGLLLGSGLAFSFFMAAFTSSGQIYAAEMFPTVIRSTAVGMDYIGVRAGSAVVPVVLLPLLLDHGPVLAFGVIAALLFAAAAIARLFGPAIMPRAHLS
jgi:MFS transporter, putative metabolite:H+ symporter